VADFFGRAAWCVVGAERPDGIKVQISAQAHDQGKTLSVGDLTRCGSAEHYYLSHQAAIELAEQLLVGTPKPLRPRTPIPERPRR
jgi:hypothetical protein